jgi:glycylpeptide N-tetradecanoyltransferase
VEINYLCVHKKLRDKRLAPVLIKEITRRVNLTGIFQAVYTAGKVLPKPVSRCRYYHRSLNPKKLIEVGFSYLGNLMTMSRAIKLYKLPDTPTTLFVPLTPEWCPSACKLINSYLERFQLRPVYSLEEFSYWFLPRPGVVSSFVRVNSQEDITISGITSTANPKPLEVTDLVSYYSLPSTIIGNTKHQTLRAAYSFYNVFTSIPVSKGIQDALIFARSEGFDVYNCLDLMENEKVLTDLKFGRGDGSLQYYLYNWRCSEMKPDQVGLVLF